MQYLIGKGLRIEENLNQWGITPLEMAVITEQAGMIDWLFQKNVSKNLDKALVLAVKAICFTIIEQLVRHQVPITDEAIEVAKARDVNLSYYLEERRKAEIQQIIQKGNILKALQYILNYPTIPMQLMVDLICDYSEVINFIENPADGNTPLHQLILEKNPVKIKAFMGAILESGYFIKGLNFNIEQKNKANQTVLDLALASQDKDVIAAVILYGNPDITPVETQLSSYNIKLGEIMRERARIDQKAREKMSHMLLSINRCAMEANLNVGLLASQQKDMTARLNGLMRLVEVLTIECQESRRECAELRVLLKEARPDISLPSQVSSQSISLNRNNFFAITDGQEILRLDRPTNPKEGSEQKPTQKATIESSYQVKHAFG